MREGPLPSQSPLGETESELENVGAGLGWGGLAGVVVPWVACCAALSLTSPQPSV